MTATARVEAAISSTIGLTSAADRPASTLARMFRELTLSNSREFTRSRERLWMTRAPETFSWRLALTAEMVARAARKVRRALPCQIQRVPAIRGTLSDT